MDTILDNPGLNHIVKLISSHLNPKSLAQCRLVCKSWRDLIDNHRTWMVFQLDHIKNKEKYFFDYEKEKTLKKKLSKSFPEWNTVIEQMSKKQNLRRLEEFVKHMWTYFNDNRMSYHTNPLHDAAAKSNLEFVQLLIDCGINLGMKNPCGSTPLHYACQQGNIEMVQLLIKYSTIDDAYAKGGSARTIFHFAAENSDVQVLKLILDTFKFEDLRDKHGYTMLLCAVESGPKETIEFLLESRHKIGFNTEDRTSSGKTILHIACEQRDIEVIDPILKYIEDNNIDIDLDTGDDIGHTPLHFSLANKKNHFSLWNKKSNPAVPIHLLKRLPTSKINDLELHGMNLLHCASKVGNVEFLKSVFEDPYFDIDVDCVDINGKTPLHHACLCGHFEAVKFLIKTYKSNGIDINAKDNNQQTAEELMPLNYPDSYAILMPYAIPGDDIRIRELFIAERVVKREERVVTRSISKANKE